MLKKTCLLLGVWAVVQLSASHPAYTTETLPLDTGGNTNLPANNGFAAERVWINLNEISPLKKLEILKKDVYADPAFFPPLYQAAYDLQQLFEVGGVKYMASFGVTLGIARFGQALPWDDDIDYVVTIDQEDKLKELIPLADKLGYDLFPDDIVRDEVPGDALVGYKFYRRKPFSIDPDTKKKCWIFIDIFLFQPSKDNPEKYIHTREKKQNDPTYFKKEELENITFMQCGPIKRMPCSAYMERLLCRGYGDDYKKTARFYWSHSHDVKTCYIWTIQPEDEYPDHKSIKLEKKVLSHLLKPEKM